MKKTIYQLNLKCLGKIGVADVLIENGANFQFRDIDGVTPLHMAAAHGNLEIDILLMNCEL